MLKFGFQVMPVFVGPALYLIAQAAPPLVDINPSVVSLVGNGVTVIVLAWYVIYDVRTRTPAMMKTFGDEQAAQRETFHKEQDETRNAHLKSQADMREANRQIVEGLRATFSTEQQAQRQSFASEQAAIRAQYDRELTELRSMLYKNLESMRTAVHDVRDTVQPLLLQGAIKAREAASQTG